MNNGRLAPHEALEVRELVSQEMLGIKKISASMNMVNDTELKNFMQDSIASKKTALQNIQSALGTQNQTV
jgi:similar to spore coat protein